ncbi:hypothetical protein BGZ81_006302 [Podila clonocystis]|nr:hypothetical protein BGZ81_006302 [Podila clonocystis]
MDSLPLEAFQLICSFCSLHALANLRLVSKSFLARVDGSLTARRTTARPAKVVAAKDNHDADACYIRLTLGRVHDPINIVFDNYNQEHNYLEFVQRSPPALVGSSRLFNTPITTPSSTTSPTPTTTTPTLRDENNSDHTRGRLDLNLWEQQLQSRSEATQKPATPPPTASRPRRSSITQASVIRHTEYRMEQELASPGPITPVSQIRPVRNALSSALGSSSTSSSSPSPSSNRNIPGQNESYMARFARMILGEAEPAPAGPSAVDLAERARLLFHAVDNEALSAQKEYKFGLSEGVHYVGDQDFIMRYTITFGLEKPEDVSPGATTETQGETQEPTQLSFADIINQERPFRLMLHVDYIRVSWKWITCGASPIKVKARQAGVRVVESIVDPMAQEYPLPHLRIGGIYANRFNRLLQEIKKQDASRHIRSELAMLGYDASILPRGFLSVNMRSEPVLRWVTGESEQSDLDHERREQDQQRVEVLLDENEVILKASQGDEDLDSDWEDLATSVHTQMGMEGKGKAKQGDPTKTVEPIAKESEMDKDQAVLEETVLEMKNNLGHLTTRQVLEEMLANQGYSRELVWKYGIVRRDLMGAVPEPGRADLLLKKIIASESTK